MNPVVDADWGMKDLPDVKTFQDWNPESGKILKEVNVVK
jgi:hypothetical protein